MSTSPVISIIVPCYNHARFLPARLESISKQSFSDFEIILLDDASPDNSQAVLQAFAKQESRVSVTDFNAQNGGCVNDQWIKGVHLARGDYVWIAESDDVSRHDFLEVLLQQFESSPQISMAYSDSMIIDESGTPLMRYDYSSDDYKNRWQNNFVLEGKTLINEHLVFKNVIPNVSAVLFKKNNLKAALQKSTMKYCGDWMCYVRVLSNSAIAYVNQPLNFFRAHVQSTRWHNQDSYKVALMEKKAILKEIKRLEIPDSLENISRSFRRMFKNRHKFKRISKLYNVLDSSIACNDSVALYGFNDISEYLLLDFSPQIRFSVIFDNDEDKQGTEKNGVPVKSLTKEWLEDIDVVVICSFAYIDEMRASLQALRFRGNVLTL
ncbi:glycosyltransferase [uncultured Alteromonas sp.]|uniref:glycosyltransferase n=1 Tax=uncultured Alteromonas sp. TaxID=179113 RepID=UPI0025E5F8CD|nr:glycosyltransferase [uncultured Alteromonas sp.]